MLDIERIRKDFPALENYVWFQNGGVSITPKPVAEVHIECMHELLNRGPMHIAFPNEELPRRERSMARIARFFCVHRDEIALMRGVSEGFQTVLRGLDWKARDQIVITAEEEAALLLPCLQLRDLYGVEIVKVPLIDDVDAQVKAVAERLTDRTRLVAFSHVTTDLGFRLPAKEICALTKERGILSFVDMAHSCGLYPISLKEIGCSFAGILSYKWMYSPYAAGVLYVDAEHLEDIAVRYIGGRAQAWLDFDSDQFGMRETAERFQYGPWSWPLVHAWVSAMDYLSDIGLEAIWDRTVFLTDRLKAGLETIPRYRAFTPKSPSLSAALVSFGIEGCDGVGLRDALRERWNIVIKALMHGSNGLRASVPFFLLEDEIDLLIEKLGILADEGSPSE